MLFRYRDDRSPNPKSSVFLTSSPVTLFLLMLVLIPVLVISILMTWTILKDLLASIL